MARLIMMKPRVKWIACGIIIVCYIVFVAQIQLSPSRDIAPEPEIHRIKESAEHYDNDNKPSVLTFEEELKSLKEIGLLMDNLAVVHGNAGRRRTSTSELFGQKTQSGQEYPPKGVPKYCGQFGFNKTSAMDYPKTTLIISFIDITAEEAVTYLSRILRHTSDGFTSDVIITVDDAMRGRGREEHLEEAVDLCPVCRLFFFEGTIYQHRNRAVTFARSPILVFVDGRIEPSSHWLEPLIFHLTFNPMTVISPHLRLRLRKGNSQFVISEGFSRPGMTWDFEVVRIGLNVQQTSKIQTETALNFNQTAIVKEVFAIEKEHFLNLDSFDILQKSNGGEHASFSMKVINCGGEIFTSVCSQVFLDVYEKRTNKILSEALSPSARDFISPSFKTSIDNSTVYTSAMSYVWMDAYSLNLFRSSNHRQQRKPEDEEMPGDEIQLSTPLSTRRRRNAQSSYNHNKIMRYNKNTSRLKSKMKEMECDITNFRYVLTRYQPTTIGLDRHTTKYGYIRSLDGMYAFGLDTNKPSSSSSSSSSSSPSSSFVQSSVPSELLTFNYLKKFGRNMDLPALVLTKNASQWIGPLSYSGGIIHFNRLWCLTVVPSGNSTSNDKNNNDNTDNNNNNINNSNDIKNNRLSRLTLQLCGNPQPSQTFIFKKNVLRWAGNGAKMCVIAKRSPDTVIGGGEKGAGFNAPPSHDLVLTNCDYFDGVQMKHGGGGSGLDYLKIDLELDEGRK